MKSKLFYTEAYKQIEEKVFALLSGQEAFLSERTARSTRAVGDAIQDIIGESFQEILGPFCRVYSTNFARRAMADLAFTDPDEFYYVVDVKTHRVDTKFNMPNLTSVERLARFYEDDKNYFVVLVVKYLIEGITPQIREVRFIPSEFLMWDCLTIGALGWGQIQIANSNYINIQPGYSRRKWMLELCDALLVFYPRELAKINLRIERFREIRAFWERKSDN